MKLILSLFLFAITASVGCSKYNHRLKDLEKKYKTLSPKSVRLSDPIKLIFEDTVAIRDAMNLYNKYVGDNGIDFFQIQNRILLKYNLQDDIYMADINGIRIIKGLNTESSGETNQNQIIKFLNLI